MPIPCTITCKKIRNFKICSNNHYPLFYFSFFRNYILGQNPQQHQQRKFIVYESCLQILMAVCFICMLPCQVILDSCNGSMATIKAVCGRGHVRIWHTQPTLGRMPQGNLDLAAAILFSGSTASKALNMLKHMNVCTITTRTYLRLQKFYLIPAVFKVIIIKTNLVVHSISLTLWKW